MLKIRLQRTGKKNQPFFRIVVTDKKNSPKGGRAVEILGFLNPRTKEKKVNLERVKYWLSVGAQPSDRVHNLLVGEGIVKDAKRPAHAKPKKPVSHPESADEGSQTPPVKESGPGPKEQPKPEPAQEQKTAQQEPVKE